MPSVNVQIDRVRPYGSDEPFMPETRALSNLPENRPVYAGLPEDAPQPSPINLLGGRYTVRVTGSGHRAVLLNRVIGDGEVAVAASFEDDDSTQTLDLEAGHYDVLVL